MSPLLHLLPRLDGGSTPPLTPSGNQARSQLRDELAHPGYLDTDVVQRVLTWLQRLLDGGSGSASGISSLSWLAITALVLALVVGLTLLAARTRRTVRADRERTAVIGQRGVGAGDLRAAAERALAEGRYADAVLDGFRALAVGEVERGRLPDDPGLTAVEVATALSALDAGAGAAGPDVAGGAALAEAADLFDATLYGDRQPTRAQATEVVALAGTAGTAGTGTGRGRITVAGR